MIHVKDHKQYDMFNPFEYLGPKRLALGECSETYSSMSLESLRDFLMTTTGLGAGLQGIIGLAGALGMVDAINPSSISGESRPVRINVKATLNFC